jgi:hypothetical protein
MDRNPHYETEIKPRQATAPARGGSEGETSGLPEMKPPARLYTIREIAREFQVTIRALRFYEDRGGCSARDGRAASGGMMIATGSTLR